MKLNYDIIQYSTYVISVIVGLSGFIIYKLQNKIICAANCPIDSRKVTYTPKDFEMDDYEDLDIKTKDGIIIKAFLVKKFVDDKKTRLAKTTLIYFHANAGNMVNNQLKKKEKKKNDYTKYYISTYNILLIYRNN